MRRPMINVPTRAGNARLSVTAANGDRQDGIPDGAVRLFTFRKYRREYTCQSGKKMARLDFFSEEDRRWGNIFLDLDHPRYGAMNRDKLANLCAACRVAKPEDLIDDFHQMVASVLYKNGSGFPMLGDFMTPAEWRRLGSPKTLRDLRSAQAVPQQNSGELPF